MECQERSAEVGRLCRPCYMSDWKRKHGRNTRVIPGPEDELRRAELCYEQVTSFEGRKRWRKIIESLRRSRRLQKG